MAQRPGDDAPWPDDPGLAALGRRLRDELLDEAREVEALVEDSELRARTLEDVGLEIVNRGDKVMVDVPDKRFVGTLTYAGQDFLTLQDEESLVDVSMTGGGYFRVVERSKSGGRARGEGPGTFEMRLVELKTEMTTVEIGLAVGGQVVTGKIHAVGQDHVVIVDQTKDEWYVPLGSVSYVIRRLGRR